MFRNNRWTHSHGLRVMLATLLVGSAVGAGGVAWSQAESQTALPPLGLPEVTHQVGFADLAANVKPAVVQIATTEQRAKMEMQNIPQNTPFGDMFRQFFGQNGQTFEWQNSQPTHALGSGFIVDPAGYIVTNDHVVDGAHEIKVTLTDGTEYNAKVIGRDSKTDLALLKIDAGGPLPYVAFGDSSKEHDGDWVIAVGNPYGLGGTVTAGIVSARNRNINSGTYDDFLQIDAPINPGNSGGPLFNQSGHVIGIDTSIYSPSGGSVGIGFAIPSNLAKNIVTQLRENGKVDRGWLGVQMQPLTPALAKAVGLPNDNGVLVDEVQPNSPAAQAMLQQGDVIRSFNGTEIKTPRDLALEVANMPAGKAAAMSVWRDNQARTLDITIGTQPSNQVASTETTPSKTSLGMTLKALTEAERDQFGLRFGVTGPVVDQVDPDSLAWESGVREGDVIVRVDNHVVVSPSQAARDIRTAEQENKEQIPIVVDREGTTFYLGLKLATG